MHVGGVWGTCLGSTCVWGTWISDSRPRAGTHAFVWPCVSVRCETTCRVVRRMARLVRVAVRLGGTCCEPGAVGVTYAVSGDESDEAERVSLWGTRVSV